jgi:hypothetical protein
MNTRIMNYKNKTTDNQIESEREKRKRKKTSSKFLADVDVGLSCAEFISIHLCPASVTV